MGTIVDYLSTHISLEIYTRMEKQQFYL